jgi:Protein of unknown function (DUF1488)
MPLTRLSDAFHPDVDGIYFGMNDGTKTVTCMVTYEALQDWVRGAPLAAPEQNECVAIFTEERSQIESVASAKYDAGRAEPDGSVRVRTRDLNPDQFSAGNEETR